MIFKQSCDLTKPMYFTILSWWRFLRRSISACHKLRSALPPAGFERSLGWGGGEILTSIMRSSLFGRSAILICLTATASPVPQLKALYTEPKAPLPMQSPSLCASSPRIKVSKRPSRVRRLSSRRGSDSYVVLQPGILQSPLPGVAMPMGAATDRDDGGLGRAAADIPPRGARDGRPASWVVGPLGVGGAGAHGWRTGWSNNRTRTKGLF